MNFKTQQDRDLDMGLNPPVRPRKIARTLPTPHLPGQRASNLLSNFLCRLGQDRVNLQRKPGLSRGLFGLESRVKRLTTSDLRE
jgi:hypothetical protein